MIISIADGDTITISSNKNNKIKIRYACIDTPEEGEPFYSKAREINSSLITDKLIDINIIDIDKYKRKVAFVYAYNNSFFAKLQLILKIRNDSINEKLLESGLANYYDVTGECRKFPYLLNSQKYAFNNNLGIWSLYSKFKDAEFIGSSKRFHLFDCENIKKVRKPKKITLKEAIYGGFSPCKNCKPLLILSIKK